MGSQPATRVIVTVPWGERHGGAETMLHTFLMQLVQDSRRIEPTVVFLEDGQWRHELSASGIRTEVLAAGRLRQLHRWLSVTLRLGRLLRRERPDVLVNWMAKTHVYGAWAAVLAGMSDRVVWWQHDIPSGHWLDRLATLLPAGAVGCSSEASAGAQRRLRPARRTFVVNPGIEAPSPVGSLSLDLPASCTVVGIVGRLQPWKGQDRLLLALAELRSRGVAVHGLVVGGDAYGLSPRYAADISRLVDSLDLTACLTLIGQVPEVGRYIREMDVLVNASVGEPFGIVLLEAMAMGVPVVAVAKGGPLEIVEPNVTGLLVPTGEPVEFADALETLANDPALRARMGAAARRRFEERFTAQHMTTALTRTLERFADRAA